MRVAFILLSFFLFQITQAQEEEQEKSKILFDGVVNLLDGSTVSGKTIYDLREQKVKVYFGEDFREIKVSQIQSMTLTSKEGNTHEFLLVAIKQEGYTKPKLQFAEILYRSENHFSLFTGFGANSFRVVNDGPPGFYSSRVVSIRKNEKKDSFRERNNAAFSRRTEEWFILDYEGNQFAADRYGVLSAYREYTRQIKKYVSKNKLNFRDPDDMITILKYADSLAEAGN